jgi:hypothetical protein
MYYAGESGPNNFGVEVSDNFKDYTFAHEDPTCDGIPTISVILDTESVSAVTFTPWIICTRHEPSKC